MSHISFSVGFEIGWCLAISHEAIEPLPGQADVLFPVLVELVITALGKDQPNWTSSLEAGSRAELGGGGSSAMKEKN